MRFEWLDKRAYYIQLSEPQTSPRWELVLKCVLILKQNLTKYHQITVKFYYNIKYQIRNSVYGIFLRDSDAFKKAYYVPV